VATLVTVVIGVLIFLIGQLILRVIIEPIAEQRRVIADTGDELLARANLYSNPIGGWDAARLETGDVIRKCAGRLGSRALLVPYYRVWQCMGLLRPRKSITEARTLLFKIYNTMPDKGTGNDNHERAVRVRELLGLPSHRE